MTGEERRGELQKCEMTSRNRNNFIDPHWGRSYTLKDLFSVDFGFHLFDFSVYENFLIIVNNEKDWQLRNI